LVVRETLIIGSTGAGGRVSVGISVSVGVGGWAGSVDGWVGAGVAAGGRVLGGAVLARASTVPSTAASIRWAISESPGVAGAAQAADDPAVRRDRLAAIER